MKSVKSIAGIASLALVINFSGLINDQSNVLKNYSVSYAQSYSERSSKDNYTKFKYKHDRDKLRSINGVKINGVEYRQVREGKDIKEGYYSGKVWGVHKDKYLYIQPKVSTKDKVEFLINGSWVLSNKNLETDGSSGATPEEERDSEKYPANLPDKKILVDNISKLSYEE
ncbi:hypothetical protein [Anaerococcus hydrogenalis]|uniref:hypothetical protein n=1 Tax=Anaerococcus hydrogenalis TaxID=33029 RepID=UPI0023F2EC62|nr:hypothetical protein [Anaerococcus hydrogenalis]